MSRPIPAIMEPDSLKRHDRHVDLFDGAEPETEMASQDDRDWPAAPNVLTLSSGDVDVWRVDLDREIPARASATLSADERERASQFAFTHLTSRFVAGRAALRAILGRYLDVPPGDIMFTYTERGKPLLSTPATLAFNISHSHTLALCAVTVARTVGVDVEHIRADRNLFRALERFFSPSESATLRELDPSVRLRACYACWTRKEAFLKACGEGLSLSTDTFDVSCAPGFPDQIVEIRSPRVQSQQWTLATLAPAETFIGAVVVEGTDCRIRQWRWQWPK